MVLLLATATAAAVYLLVASDASEAAATAEASAVVANPYGHSGGNKGRDCGGDKAGAQALGGVVEGRLSSLCLVAICQKEITNCISKE